MSVIDYILDIFDAIRTRKYKKEQFYKVRLLYMEIVFSFVSP